MFTHPATPFSSRAEHTTRKSLANALPNKITSYIIIRHVFIVITNVLFMRTVKVHDIIYIFYIYIFTSQTSYLRNNSTEYFRRKMK